MADQGKHRKLIPSAMSRERTLVYVILIAVVAIILIVVALTLATSPSSNGGGKYNPPGGGYNTPPTTTSNQTSQNVKVDSYHLSQNATSGESTFSVTVTNTGSTDLTKSVNVAVGQVQMASSPNQPYPTRETPVNNPVLMNSTVVSMTPGQTTTVPVVVQTPPGFTVDPATVLITVT